MLVPSILRVQNWEDSSKKTPTPRIKDFLLACHKHSILANPWCDTLWFAFSERHQAGVSRHLMPHLASHGLLDKVGQYHGVSVATCASFTCKPAVFFLHAPGMTPCSVFEVSKTSLGRRGRRSAMYKGPGRLIGQPSALQNWDSISAQIRQKSFSRNWASALPLAMSSLLLLCTVKFHEFSGRAGASGCSIWKIKNSPHFGRWNKCWITSAPSILRYLMMFCFSVFFQGFWCESFMFKGQMLIISSSLTWKTTFKELFWFTGQSRS